MGGGAAMRTAASRLIGAGSVVGLGGLVRGTHQTVPRPDQQMFTAAARRPAASALLNTDQKSASTTTNTTTSSWAVDDWEFAGLVEDDVAGGVDQMPRVVFGGAPTLEEAKEATMELKEAVEKTMAISGYQEPKMELLMEEVVEKSEVVSASEGVPKHAAQAFRFLSENPAAQNVVASIASDPNVWNAVLQNTAFVDYLESHKTGGTSPDVDARSNQCISVMELQDLNFCAESEASFAGATQHSESGVTLTEILENIKLTVIDIVDSVSAFFQDIFSIPETDNKPTDDVNSVRSSFIESTTFKASIMGLAIMVISMVVLKRA